MGPVVALSEYPSEAANQARQSGEAIIGLLEEAVRVAKRREADVRADVTTLLQDLRPWDDRVAAMEAAVADAQARSEGAERWLADVYRHVETFAQDLAGQRETSIRHLPSAPDGWDLRLRASS